MSENSKEDGRSRPNKRLSEVADMDSQQPSCDGFFRGCPFMTGLKSFWVAWLHCSISIFLLLHPDC